MHKMIQLYYVKLFNKFIYFDCFSFVFCQFVYYFYFLAFSFV